MFVSGREDAFDSSAHLRLPEASSGDDSATQWPFPGVARWAAADSGLLGNSEEDRGWLLGTGAVWSMDG